MYNMDILNSDKQFEIKYGSRNYGQKYYLFNKLLIKLKFNVSSIGFRLLDNCINNCNK